MKKGYWFIIVIVLLLVAGYFYWFQWRPRETRKDCNKSAEEISEEHTDRHWHGVAPPSVSNLPDVEIEKGYEYDTLYTQCSRERGIK